MIQDYPIKIHRLIGICLLDIESNSVARWCGSVSGFVGMSHGDFGSVGIIMGLKRDGCCSLSEEEVDHTWLCNCWPPNLLSPPLCNTCESPRWVGHFSPDRSEGPKLFEWHPYVRTKLRTDHFYPERDGRLISVVCFRGIIYISVTQASPFPSVNLTHKLFFLS